MLPDGARFSPSERAARSTRQQEAAAAAASSASRAARMPVNVADPRRRLGHPRGKTSTVSTAATRMASATGRWVVCPAARQAAARPMAHSMYCGLSTGLSTSTSSVTASGASAANSGRHRMRPRAVATHQAVTAAAMRIRPSLDASCASPAYSPLSCHAPYS
jgi:hypothetical protein